MGQGIQDVGTLAFVASGGAAAAAAVVAGVGACIGVDTAGRGIAAAVLTGLAGHKQAWVLHPANYIAAVCCEETYLPMVVERSMCF